MKFSLWIKVRFWLSLMLVFLITISSHPTIVDISQAAGITSGTVLSRYIILAFAVLFLMCFNLRSMLRARLIRVSWLMYFLIVFCFLITFTFYGKDTMLSDVRSIAICLVAIMIGWQLNLDENKFKVLLLSFSILTLFVGFMQIMRNIGGLQILDQYQTDNKNSLGVMLSSCAIVYFIMGLNRAQKGFAKIMLFVLFVLTLLVLLTIRARAAMIATVLVLLYMFYERFKGKNFVYYLLIAAFVVIIVFFLLPPVAKEYVYNSFFQHQEGDFTSGRIERNSVALQFLKDHIFIGNLNQNIKVDQIHNYPLNRLFEFGIVFVFPILLLYFYILMKAIVKTVKSDNHNTHNIGYYLLLIPFIISLAEPTFPFGPGTATVFNFLVFGLALRYSDNEKHEISPNL